MNIHSRTIFENTLYRLYHIYEDVYISDKLNGRVDFVISCYGDPSAGIIDKHNRWCIIGGESLILYDMSKKTPICVDGLKWIYALRQTEKDVVQILTDPWSQDSAIWALDTITIRVSKVRGFNNYQNCEYTEFVKW